MFEDVLREWGGVEVSAAEVYTDIFRLGDNLIQRNGEPSGQHKANPVGYYLNEGKRTGHYRVFFDDDFMQTLKELQDADFAILNGLSYFGRNNKQENASKMYALIIDLDGVTDKTLNNLLSGGFNADVYPVPNYIALSGHGVHLYYIFENPISLYPNTKLQLKSLKYALIDKIWNEYTSTDKRKQYQGINQGFRPIGAKTKILGVRVRAFRIHAHPFTLKQLGEYIPVEYRVDESKLYKESRYTLDEAKKKFPEWYEKRVLQKQPKGTWTCKRDLYDWWLRQIKGGASFGHRYFCIMALSIYAVKSGIDYKELKRDAVKLIPFLNAINPSQPFTRQDVMSALECYEERYCTFPRDDIEKISNIKIPPNKRNYRKQKLHLQLARATKAILKDAGEMKPEGRPDKADIVREWQRSNPNGTKADCIRDTGLSKPTVLKYWI